ncbi:Cobaltochelatase subunit CobN [Bosea sp. 62]|uniref:cobaltochelatase subunit CobN n=1 Tax=unclassified Bosea (in: a-proteobacteria) TaxID=2653178 RepID=UPI00125C8123|nr:MULTISPECIES: cobaltochelatase subunit CobN [unclassified Bosea (in: a-proteobacteria)]CAD5288502.1 Cobaltochelatase subunit CobN [Bosea sp. 21B]CAD5290804.1 Cobaltochelatase subunit CobN [Bosea sp. 46]CAD5300834.1 Cobaltochelatase subunit CobN [Bosea sp. 7B]VVT60345.1 Cobaltochelatase CobN [Bosea sp. EC-HK365B]VXA96659.1 Cobaltochelatase subunit CobN [Bosea sp. 62]
MHLLSTSEVRLDDGEDAVDLALPPGDLVVLSFSDSDLSALAAAAPDSGLDLRLVPLRRFKHPLSIDLLIEKTLAGSRFVLLRCLGGLDYLRYGVEQIAAACRQNGIALAVLPGDDREDERLAGYGTVPPEFAAELLGYFHAGGGAENMRRLLARIDDYLAALPSSDPASPGHLLPRGEKGQLTKSATTLAASFSPRGRRSRQGDEGRRDLAPIPLPTLFGLGPNAAPLPWREALAILPANAPLIPILVYRSGVAAGDTAMVEAIAAALAGRGLAALPLALTSLKDASVTSELAALIATRKPALIVTTTAFSARDGEGFVLDAADCPILQAVPVGSAREAWEASPRGLSAADLAMQAALPEFDGRLGAMPVAFKQEINDPATGLTLRRLTPDADGIADLADLAANWVALGRKPRSERQVALVMSDYPARGGRAGFAVGLDTPASALAIRELLNEAGYEVGPAPSDTGGADLMQALTEGPVDFAVPLAAYRSWVATIPAAARETLLASHGSPETNPACDGASFRFRLVRFGKLAIALQPPRDASPDRKVRYHDPDAPPGHAYLAFYLGLREILGTDALIHLGTHGTTEWLPGKAVALSAACWPRLAVGALPVIYPYVVDDPGEAAPAKRRLSALTLGHLPPPLAAHDTAGEAALLRDLVEEYSQAQVLDPRRAELVAREILDRAKHSGLAAASGVTPDQDMPSALAALDAHLCDLAETAFRDGLHVFGSSDADPASAGNERRNLLKALDAGFVPPGPAGAPHRGRPDVLPSGRNLSTLDPRALPTRSAARLGARAAEAVIARHLQDEGDYPRRIVMDLWASPTLRSGGEDIAHALHLMGVEPLWDHGSTRVTGFSIIPQAKFAAPRADVTIRISGAFRDTFPAQIALLDAAARAVAALDEPDEWNEPAAAHRRGKAGARIFGAAPGRYGAAMADRALDGDWQARGELGEAYLAATSHAYGGPDGAAAADAGFANRVAEAQAFVHVSDTAGRDILEATSAADVIGGFVAAMQAQGGKAALYSLDTSDPDKPKARTLAEDVSRIVHGRLCHPRWIASHLAHGWRGAAELAEAVDALFVYAAATDAVSDGLFDAVFQAYCGDPAIWQALERANAPAAASIRARLAEAQERGLWTSRSNSAAMLSGREAAE